MSRYHIRVSVRRKLASFGVYDSEAGHFVTNPATNEIVTFKSTEEAQACIRGLECAPANDRLKELIRALDEACPRLGCEAIVFNKHCVECPRAFLKKKELKRE